MKGADVRLYRPDDFEEVVGFLRAEGFDPPAHPDDFGGLAMLARTDDERSELIGFVWALWAPGLRVAYVDFFAVKSPLRKSSVAFLLGMTLSRYLQEFGVARILWVTPTWNWSFIRAMKLRGAQDLGARQALVTEIEQVDTSVKEEAHGRVLHQHADNL